MNESKKSANADAQASDPDDLLDIVVMTPNQATKLSAKAEDAPILDPNRALPAVNGANVRATENIESEALTNSVAKGKTTSEATAIVLSDAKLNSDTAMRLEVEPISVETENALARNNDETVNLVDIGDESNEFGAQMPADEPPQENWLALLVKETLETVVLAVVIFLLIRVGIQNYRIEGSSMEPNFHNGEYLLVNKISYRLGEFQRGDVIVFKYPGDTTKDYIKRVIGLPGDTVEIRSGVLLVNGQEVSEPYDIMPMNFINEPPIVVESGYLYVMGDNRPASSDTRDWGLLDEDLVIGQAWLAIYPLDTFGLVDHPELHFTPGMAQGP